MKRLFLALLLAVTIISCRDYRMQSSSMEPTIKDGEVFEADYTAYVDQDPQRWDVVVFESTVDSNKVWCHRIVGLPGETIDIQDSMIVINGVVQPYPQKMAGVKYASTATGVIPKITFPYKIPTGSYFLLGDNTDGALDSRYAGPIPRKNIIARVENK